MLDIPALTRASELDSTSNTGSLGCAGAGISVEARLLLPRGRAKNGPVEVRLWLLEIIHIFCKDDSSRQVMRSRALCMPYISETPPKCTALCYYNPVYPHFACSPLSIASLLVVLRMLMIMTVHPNATTAPATYVIALLCDSFM